MDAYVVVGMHRTGTSAIMAVLYFLKIDIGYAWTPQMHSHFNEKGYFENIAFQNFERYVLKKAGGSWHEPPDEKHIYDVFQGLKNRFLKLTKNHSSEKWGYKAIRGGIFPETLTEIPNLHLIVSLRSPLSVAKSLENRDQFEYAKSIELYSTYYYRIFKMLSRHPEIPFIIVNYDDLIESTEAIVRKIAGFAGIEPTKKQIDVLDKFIEKRLRHF